MANDFLKIDNLRKVYNPDTVGEVVALNDLSFSIAEGEFVTIVGSNAAGKTTLFNALAGSLSLTMVRGRGKRFMLSLLLREVPGRRCGRSTAW